MPGEPGLLLATEISRQNVSKEGWTTYYVSKDGNDGANGLKWESAFLTIQRAIDVAESWAKIYVRAGTYAENVILNKEGIRLIGENRANVIIRPTTGLSIRVDSELCTVETLKCFSVITTYGLDIQSGATRTKIIDVEFDGVADAYGIHSWADFIEVRDCYMSNDNIKYGISLAGGRCKVHNNYIKLTRANAKGVYLLEDSTLVYNNHVYENTIECEYCIDAIDSSKNASVFHNNFINYLRPIKDLGTDNKFFENFYDTHTTDTNNDGLCDTPYTWAGTVMDYSPVSKRNGWLQQSLGTTPSSSITIDKIYNAVTQDLPIFDEYWEFEQLDAAKWEEILDGAGTGTFTALANEGIMFYRLVTGTVADNNAILNSKYRWMVTPDMFSDSNTPFTSLNLEFLARFVEVELTSNQYVTLGFTEAKNNDNDAAAGNDIAAFILKPTDVLNARTSVDDIDEDTDVSSGITLTNWNLYKIVVAADAISFYINDALKATHDTHIPNMACYLLFGTRTAAGIVATTLDIGIVRAWYGE